MSSVSGRDRDGEVADLVAAGSVRYSLGIAESENDILEEAKSKTVADTELQSTEGPDKL